MAVLFLHCMVSRFFSVPPAAPERQSLLQHQLLCIKRDIILQLFSDYSGDTTELFEDKVASCLPILPISSRHLHKHAHSLMLINC